MLKQSKGLKNSRFVGADLDFVASVLAPSEQRLHLEKLWEDRDAQRDILDLKEVFRGLLNSQAAVQVSPHFYFYVLVRHAFMDAQLHDADLADYVSGVIAKSIHSEASDPLHNLASGFTCASDFLAVISSAKGRMRYHLQVAAGNQFLILTGLYPGFLRARSERRGGPGLEFYESFARRSYQGAAGNSHAGGRVSRNLLGSLAESMPMARQALNRVADEFVFLGE